VLIVLLLFGAAIFCGEAARLYRGYATHGDQSREGANVAIAPRESATRFLRRLLTPQALLSLLIYLTVVIVQAIR
jgi:hypothetical protein